MPPVKNGGITQLLQSFENNEKNDLNFDVWITGRDRHFMERQLIPNRLDIARAQTLPEFVREREHLIRDRLLRFADKVTA